MTITVNPLMEYDADIAEKMGVLLKDLSSHYEGEAVPRETIEDIIESPWHDILVATNEEGALVSSATLRDYVNNHTSSVTDDQIKSTVEENKEN